MKYDEEESEEKEESEKKSFEGLFMDKPKDEHDDDNDEGFVTLVGSRKTSDDYRIELAKLESEKEKLIKELVVYWLMPNALPIPPIFPQKASPKITSKYFFIFTDFSKKALH